MRERDGFLLVFNVTDRSTFEDLQGFYDQLAVMHEEGMPPLVIGEYCCVLVSSFGLSCD